MNKVDHLKIRVGKGSRTICTVEVVSTPDAIIKGLSGRAPLMSGHGMLFVFPEISKQSMWMPEMKFPLDIIWLDENFTIVHITKDCKPCKTRLVCPSYSSKYQVKYAIEFKAGDADAYGFEIGKTLYPI